MQQITIIGTDSQALIGADVNLHLISSKYLSPLNSYVDSDKVLPSDTRIYDLPGRAMIVKWVGGVYQGLPLKMFRVFFTADCDNPNGRYISCYLSLGTPEARKHYPVFGGFIDNEKNLKLEDTPVDHLSFKGYTDEREVVAAGVYFSSIYQVSVKDIQAINTGMKYLLKLMALGFDWDYDTHTQRWVEGYTYE